MVFPANTVASQKMIDDLQNLSDDYQSENRDLSRRGYEGSPKPVSPLVGLPDQAPGIPYTQSQTSRRSDRSDPVLMSPPESSYGGDRYLHQSPYSSPAGQPGYTTTAGYQPVSNYQPPQVPGYQSSQGYAPVAGYPGASNYLPGSGFPPGSSYAVTSGYSAAGYPAPAGRPGVMVDPNYTYESTDYAGQNYQYGRQPASYSAAPRPGDPRADPRVDPRSASTYPFVSSAPDVSMRGVATDTRFDSYGQPITSSQASRSGFPAPSRGTPTGVYDPPQPMDGGYREPGRDNRRHR
jgi:hypothetical protein